MPVPADHSGHVRRAVIRRLLATPTITAIIGQRFYGLRVPDRPQWPFGRYGVPVVEPYEASGLGGSETDITLHLYVRGTDERLCEDLCALIVEALSSDELPLSDSVGLVSLDWLDTQIMTDGGEGRDFHAILRFRAITAQ